jgi:hypothetical protein
VSRCWGRLSAQHPHQPSGRQGGLRRRVVASPYPAGISASFKSGEIG